VKYIRGALWFESWRTFDSLLLYWVLVRARCRLCPCWKSPNGRFFLLNWLEDLKIVENRMAEFFIVSVLS